MGKCCDGVLWIVVSDLPKREEASENTEEEEIHIKGLSSRILILRYRIFVSHRRSINVTLLRHGGYIVIVG